MTPTWPRTLWTRWRTTLAGWRLPTLWAYLLAALVAIAVVDGSIAVRLSREYRQTEDGIYAITGNLAHGFADNIQRSLEAIDQTLQYVRDDYARDPVQFDLTRWTRNGPVVGRPQIRISVIDAAGTLRSTNMGQAAGKVDLSDSEIMQMQSGTAEDRLGVGLPVRASGSGRWVVNVTRKILLPGAKTGEVKFGGLVVATVALDYFTRFYETLDLTNASVLLIGADGIVRARVPPLENIVGQPYRGTGGRELLLDEADHGIFGGMSAYDGKRRLFSYNRVQDYPLLVLVGLDDAAGFETYRQHEQLALSSGAALTLLLLLMAMIMSRQHSRLLGSQNALSATLENISQGIMMIDADGRVKVANQRVLDLLELPAILRAPDTSLRDIVRWQIAQGEYGPPDQVPADTLEVLRTGVPALQIGPLVRTRPNGRVLEIRSEHLPTGGTVRTYTDISDVKRNERALANARDAAEAAGRARAEFLAVMSHEIRTPMNGIIGVAGLLMDMQLGATQAQYVRIVLDSAQHLLQLINDILDFSRLDVGRLELEETPFALADAITDSLEIVAHEARTKGLKLVTEIAPDVPPIVVGDSHRLRQILLNLVGNGIKFTTTGSVRVRVHRIRDEAIAAGATHAAGPAVRLAISVIDTGIGIAPEAISRLFTEFTQVDSSISRRFGGSGLGLAISRRLIEQMDGNIGVESAVGIGSTFHFDLRLRLPAAAAADAVPAPSPALGAAAPAAALRVLVAEDNSTNRLVITRMLERLGHSSVAVENGAEALDAAATGQFDLVVMDVMMPVMDGIAATLAIRRLPDRLGAIPVIGLTANMMAAERDRCLQAGMNRFETKPISITRLRAVIAEVCHLAPTEAEVPDSVFLPDRLLALEAQIGTAAAAMLRQFQDGSRAQGEALVALARHNRTDLIAQQARLLARAADAFGLPQLATAANAVHAAAVAGQTAELPDLVAHLQLCLFTSVDALRQWQTTPHSTNQPLQAINPGD